MINKKTNYPDWKARGIWCYKTMLKKIEKNKNFNLHLVATDQHLNPKFGKTIKEINKSFKVYKSKSTIKTVHKLKDLTH